MTVVKLNYAVIVRGPTPSGIALNGCRKPTGWLWSPPKGKEETLIWCLFGPIAF